MKNDAMIECHHYDVLMKLILLLSLKILRVFSYAAKVIHQTASREKFDRMFLQVSMN